MRLQGRVLERFQKYKKECKLTDIHYGKKAIEEMASVYFKYHENEKKKWIKKLLSKKNNAVYFIYETTVKPPDAGKRWKPNKGHRFIAPDSDLGEAIDILTGKDVNEKFKKIGYFNLKRRSVNYRKSHRRSKKSNRRRSKRKRSKRRRSKRRKL